MVSRSTGSIIQNNIFVSMASNALYVSGGSTATEDYNIFYQSAPPLSPGPHSQVADPMFAVAAPKSANDVKLMPGSPAIGAGANLGPPFNLALDPSGSAVPYPTIDQDTLSRGWAIGAFAYR
jgi:hypothetical protein